MLHRTTIDQLLFFSALTAILTLVVTMPLRADDRATAEPPAVDTPTGETDPPQDQGREEAPAGAGEATDGEDQATGEDDGPRSLDDLLGIEEQERDHSGDEAAQRGHEEELERRLSEERIKDAFAEAIAKMSLSADLLDERFDTGLGTQRVQEEIIAKLTQLIDEAQQQQSSSSSSSSSNSSASAQPQQDPGQQGGGQQQAADGDSQDGTGDEATELPSGQEADVNVMLEETRQEWGALPDRVRDMLLQGREERFSGLYEQLTREYYRRLAED